MNLLKPVTAALKRVRRRNPPLGFTPQPHYWYLASYPKSGNTWVRYLMSHLICDEEQLDLREFGRHVPDSHIKGDLVHMTDPQSPFNQASHQFIKTHFRYRPEFQQVIYVVRDGRDTINSYYHYFNARHTEQVTVEDIIRGDISWGLWQDHVFSWLNGRCRKRLIVKYEDLFDDTVSELHRMLDFVGMDIPIERIRYVAEIGSFNSMRRSEEAMYKSKGLVADTTGSGTGTPMFVRKGGSGDWRNLFSEKDIELFWRYHRDGMRALGYEE
jgi:hypothetical protein